MMTSKDYRDKVVDKFLDGSASKAERIFMNMLVIKEKAEEGVIMGRCAIRQSKDDGRDVYHINYLHGEYDPSAGMYIFKEMIPFAVSSLYEAAYAVEKIHGMA